jgi:DNA polymerase IIIc chi subunit
MDIFFYQTQTLDRSVAQICEKIDASSKRCVIVCDTIERVDQMDSYIWSYSTMQFLPHGKRGQFEKRHPILVSTDPTPVNDATFIINMSQNTIDINTLQTQQFERYMDFFTPDQDSLNNAYNRMKSFESHGLTVQLFIQNDKGGWIKSAA